MTLLVQVFHTAFDDAGFCVASIVCPSDDVDEALNYAYRYTQNLRDSWSIKHPGNIDNNPNVMVCIPLPKINSKTFGLRSTSVGDEMLVFPGK
jgi:hypothetical protein